MSNDTAPDVREVIKRAIYNENPLLRDLQDRGDGARITEPIPFDEFADPPPFIERQADAVLTALAGLADATFAAAVQEYGRAKLQLGSAGIDDYHKGLVGTVYSQAEPLKAPAEEKERTLLALHAAATRRPVIDNAAVERLARILSGCAFDDVDDPDFWRHARQGVHQESIDRAWRYLNTMFGRPLHAGSFLTPEVE